jgi:hypothetical protein
VCIVNDAVENGIGEGRLTNQVMPAIDRDLAGYQGGAAAVAVFDNLEDVMALLGSERLEPQSSKMRSLTPPSARIRRG